LQKQPKLDAQIHKLTEGAYLFCSPQGNILFGCPPEILKRILAMHLPMPDTVVLPSKLHHIHSSQASLEFPLYHFLFVQRGLERKRQFHVVSASNQSKGLEQLLRLTVVGPDSQEMEKAGTPQILAGELYQETDYMALKDPKTGKSFSIPEMVKFLSLDEGGNLELYPLRGKFPQVILERGGEARFRVLYGEHAFDLDLTVTKSQEPNYNVKHLPHIPAVNGFTTTVLGRSNGFDPNDPANGYLLDINGRLLMWDCPAYLNLQLSKMKVGYEKVEAMILSHVHEDHIDVVESLRQPPIDLYTTPEIYYSLLVKISAVFGCSLDEAKKYHVWHPLEPEKPISLLGAEMTVFHSVHAIPSLGGRFKVEIGGKSAVLHITGDHLSHSAIQSMATGGGISERRRSLFDGLITGDEDLILVDVGGGVIHGDYHDYLGYKGRARIGFMHTGLVPPDLPDKMKLVDSGEVWTIL